jgi:hypothetical protein
MALLSRLTSSNQLTESYVRNIHHFHLPVMILLLLRHLLTENANIHAGPDICVKRDES